MDDGMSRDSGTRGLRVAALHSLWYYGLVRPQHSHLERAHAHTLPIGW